MDVDPEIAPVMARMHETLAAIKSGLLPLLADLDEDTLVTNYSLEEQARLYLAAAFTAAFSLYSLDRLGHRRFTAVQVSGAGAAPPASSGSSGGQSASADPQLILKIERITDYIRKLREITQLASSQRRQESAQSTKEEEEEDGGETLAAADASAATASSTRNTADGEGNRTAAASRKRARQESRRPRATAEESTAEELGEKAAAVGNATAAEPIVSPTAGNGDEGDLGDSAMFGVVSRVPGETGVLVSRLLRQVGSG